MHKPNQTVNIPFILNIKNICNATKPLKYLTIRTVVQREFYTATEWK